MVKLVDAKGKDVIIPGSNQPAHYFLPNGSIVNIEDKAQVGVGDIIARIPQEKSKTRDITGGLPRVADFLKHVVLKMRPFWRRIGYGDLW